MVGDGLEQSEWFVSALGNHFRKLLDKEARRGKKQWVKNGGVKVMGRLRLLKA